MREGCKIMLKLLATLEEQVNLITFDVVSTFKVVFAER